MAVLTIGQGKQFSTISSAVASSRDGDVLAIDAGIYTNDFATINTKITLQGVGGMVHMVATVAPPNGKGILVTNTDVTIDRLEFSGTTVPDMNGAGIRYQAGHLTVTNSYFHHNQNGILANADAAGSITIRNSEFSHNGAGDGQSHNLYVGTIASLIIDNSYFHDSVVGHEIKSRALNTTITNSRVAEGPLGTGSYSIDLPNGGNAVLTNNVIQQGPRSENAVIVAFGEEGNLHANTSLEMSGNTVLNDLVSSSARMLWNATATTATLTGNSVFGLSAIQYVNGPATVTDMTVLSTAPALDTSSPWANVTPTPAPAPDPASPSYLGDDNVVLTIASQNLAIDLLSGNDTLTLADGGNAGTVANVEQLIGGAGDDIVTLLNTPAGMQIDLKGGLNEIRISGAGSSLQLLNVQTVKGGLGVDAVTLKGAMLGFAMDGGAGLDSLTLADGANRVSLADVETVTGGTGADVVTLQAAKTGFNISLGDGLDELWLANGDNSGTASNVEKIVGGTGADQITLGAPWTGGSLDLGDGADRLTLFLAGANVVTVLNTETVIGGSQADTVTLGTVLLNGTFDLDGGNDTLVLAAGTNSVFTMNVELVKGNSGADTITAEGMTSVRLEGARGNDVLRGGAGNDVIYGGVGRDTMTGGAGADRFLFTSLSETSIGSPDVISDFNATMDLIAFEGVAHNGFSWRGASAFQKNGVTQGRFDERSSLLSLDMDGNGRADFALTITGVKLADLSASDFVWG